MLRKLIFAAAMTTLPLTSVKASESITDNLTKATAAGDLSLVKDLLTKKANPNALDRFGRLPLEMAAIGAHFQVVETLLNTGVKVCAKTNTLEVKGGELVVTVLNRVIANALDDIKKENLQLMKQLLEQQGCSGSFNSLLFKKTLSNGLAKIELSKDLRDRPRLYQEMFVACQNGNVEKLRELLSEKIKTAMKNEEGDTCLHLAAKNSRSKITTILIGEKVNIEQENTSGYTALALAAASNHVSEETLKTIDLLLEAGANVNHCNPTGYCPLLTSYNGENIGVVKRLLNHGAKVNAQDQGGNTALTWNIVYHPKKTDILELLIKSGADPKLRTHYKRSNFQDGSAIDFAKRMGLHDALKILSRKNP